MSTDTLGQALHYSADVCLAILPLCPPDHFGCSPKHLSRCRKPGKTPLVRWQRLAETGVSADSVERWFTRWRMANIGMLTGRPSGVVVLDVDGPTGAEAVRPYNVPATPTVRSARGLRYHFAAPSVALGKCDGLLPGVDLQADGAYGVLPPSRHLAGHIYTWEIPLEAGFAQCPEWLLELVLRPRRQARSSTTEGWPELWRGVPSGQRNTVATRLAGRLLARGLRPEEVLEILRGWDLRNEPPLEEDDEDELEGVVLSIAAREAKAGRARDQGLYGSLWVATLEHSDVAVYESIREVEAGRGFTPGQKLFVSHRELAKASGYSLGAVSIALRRLAHAGLIRYRPGTPGADSDEASEVRRVLPMPLRALCVKAPHYYPGVFLCSTERGFSEQ